MADWRARTAVSGRKRLLGFADVPWREKNSVWTGSNGGQGEDVKKALALVCAGRNSLREVSSRVGQKLLVFVPNPRP